MRLLASSLVLFAMVTTACGGEASSVTADEAPATPGAANGDPGTPVPGAADAGATSDAASDAASDGGGGGAVGVACGAATCASPAWCQVCSPNDALAARSCETDLGKSCPAGGPPGGLRMSCDGDEDCAPSERCVLYEGSIGTYTSCMAAGTIGNVVCRTLADCPVGAKACAPYDNPSYVVSVCNK